MNSFNMPPRLMPVHGRFGATKNVVCCNKWKDFHILNFMLAFVLISIRHDKFNLYYSLSMMIPIGKASWSAGASVTDALHFLTGGCRDGWKVGWSRMM